MTPILLVLHLVALWFFGLLGFLLFWAGRAILLRRPDPSPSADSPIERRPIVVNVDGQTADIWATYRIVSQPPDRRN